MTGKETWTTAYASALADPADTPPFLAQPQSFRDQTIRQAVRLRRGGSRLRLVLSNEFGQTPLVIDTVTVSGAQGKPPRTTPATAYAARPKATPGDHTASHNRVRADRVDADGKLTLRHAGVACSLSLWQITIEASSRMHVTPSSVLSATRTPGSPPCRAAMRAHATRRAAFTALAILAAVLAPPAISSSVRHTVGTEATGPNSPP